MSHAYTVPPKNGLASVSCFTDQNSTKVQLKALGCNVIQMPN